MVFGGVIVVPVWRVGLAGYRRPLSGRALVSPGTNPFRGLPVQQLSLSIEPGVSSRFRSLLECVASGVYQRGVGRVAPMVDVAPSHLSVQLSDDPSRRFAVESLELYLEKTGDFTPIYYLIDKFLRDPQARQQEAIAQLANMVPHLIATMQAAGLAPSARPSRK